ncbi:MAG: hypothetical protein R3200_09585 [Xanthomonadales bacterium]|nr:hypothetical protein [Xanthomonadales bacterium]
MRTLLIASMALASIGCASSTVIRSSDPDARIYVNGEYVGTGHAHYRDRKVSFAKNEVTIRKDGCAPAEYDFRRNEDPDFGAIVGGYFLTVPFLWTLEYKDEHAYEYDCRPLAQQ